MTTFLSSPFDDDPPRASDWKCGADLKEKFQSACRDCELIGLDVRTIETHLEAIAGCPVANFCQATMQDAIDYLAMRHVSKKAEIAETRKRNAKYSRTH